MLDLNTIFGLPFFTAFFVVLLTTPLAILLLKRFGFVDDPVKRKHPAILHSKPIPRGGGITLFLGVLIASIIFLPFTKIFIALFVASFIALLIGTIDDKYDISPYVRFFTNFLCAIIVVYFGANIPFITNPFGGILYIDQIRIPFLNINGIAFLSETISVIWIVWVMNMLNWSKGVDGQMPGIVAISATVIGILSLRFSPLDITSAHIATLSFIIAGASVGFLIFNFYPAKIFPGYGATAIYLLLSVVSILSGAKLATAILVMGVPLADGAITIIRRIFSGKSPFWHDKKHLHHLLLGIGFGQRRIALFYWIISAILGSLALILSSKEKLFAIIMVIILVGGAILFLHFLTKRADDKINL